MDQHKKQIDLIIRNLSGTATDEQREELLRWLEAGEDNRKLYDRTRSGGGFTEKMALYEGINPEKAFRDFTKRTGVTRRLLRRRLTAIAAAIVIIAIPATAFLLSTGDGTSGQDADLLLAGMGERRTQAMLILDDGSELVLDAAAEARPIIQNGSVVAHNSGSGVEYNMPEHPAEVVYNTIVTPRGGEITVTLSDGTTVHLNSSSSLRFPVTFTGDVRRVTLQGEGYFKISHNPDAPFEVEVGGITVRQMGTEFNINTFNGGITEIALVTGSVGVVTPQGNIPTLLKPSQLASYNPSSNELEVSFRDLTPFISWNTGELIFDNKPLSHIMETLSRWYDVDIVLESPETGKMRFVGRVNRSDSAQNILKAIASITDLDLQVRNGIIYIKEP